MARLPLSSLRLTYVGHSTVAIDLDGVRILTDPVLRSRMAHLRRHALPPEPGVLAGVDAVLLSHLHLDHADIPSLRLLGTQTRIIAPRGAGSMLRRRRFRVVEELAPGEAVSIGSLVVTATPAEHSGFRPVLGPTALALGFHIAGERRIYFAGDTDIFPAMAALTPGLDVALIPIWGWGPSLGPGHLDPRGAAEAVRLLAPKVAVPIHWGTFAPRGTRRQALSFLSDPPSIFREEVELLAPEVRVLVLQPGESAIPFDAQMR